MARRIVTAPEAAAGLQGARNWLTQPGSGTAGKRRWQTLLEARRRLRDWPYAGPESPEHPDCRALVVEGYLMDYRIERDTGDSATAGNVVLLAVFPPGKGDRTLG